MAVLLLRQDSNLSWDGENFWREAIQRNLYPPEADFFPKIVKSLLDNEDLTGRFVLDYCCGTGRFGKLAKDMGASVLGIDISRTLLAKASGYIDVACADAPNLPFKNKKFDYVFSFMALQVIDDFNAAISETNRILVPGGKLLLAIVSPYAEKWDINNRRCYLDYSTYQNIEVRPWVFNLKDCTCHVEQYTHRPWEIYHSALATDFDLGIPIIPKPPKEQCKNRRYASLEYLLISAVKKIL